MRLAGPIDADLLRRAFGVTPDCERLLASLQRMRSGDHVLVIPLWMEHAMLLMAAATPTWALPVMPNTFMGAPIWHLASVPGFSWPVEAAAIITKEEQR